jgi:hypothetical protein
MSIPAKTKTYKLKFPVASAGLTVSEVTMRRPTVRDQLLASKAEGSDADKELNIFAQLCEVEQDVILEMDLEDYEGLQKTYTGFRKPPKEGSESAK